MNSANNSDKFDSDQSKISAVFKCEDALINLATARREYKNAIVKYMDRISDVELHNLSKITYRDTNQALSKSVLITNEPRLNQITKQFEDTVKIPTDISSQIKTLKSEVENVHVIIRKLEQEREYVTSLL